MNYYKFGKVQNNNVGVIIQARMGSKRLPNKMNLEFFESQTILDIVLTNLLKEFDCNNIFLATSTDKENDILEKNAQKYNIKTFRGSENDVLNRFIKCANFYNIDKIIRICADNPFLQVSKIQILINNLIEQELDYYSYFINNSKPTIKTHSGFFVEAVTLTALQKVASLTFDNFYHEHVTNYIYDHPSFFKIGWLNFNDAMIDNVRLTIDTLEDFQLAQNLFKLCQPDISFENIFKVLEHNQLIIKEMKKNIENNAK